MFGWSNETVVDRTNRPANWAILYSLWKLFRLIDETAVSPPEGARFVESNDVFFALCEKFRSVQLVCIFPQINNFFIWQWIKTEQILLMRRWGELEHPRMIGKLSFRPLCRFAPLVRIAPAHPYVHACMTTKSRSTAENGRSCGIGSSPSSHQPISIRKA